jgi:hypothetical protein
VLGGALSAIPPFYNHFFVYDLGAAIETTMKKTEKEINEKCIFQKRKNLCRGGDPLVVRGARQQNKPFCVPSGKNGPSDGASSIKNVPGNFHLAVGAVVA